MKEKWRYQLCHCVMKIVMIFKKSIMSHMPKGHNEMFKAIIKWIMP